MSVPLLTNVISRRGAPMGRCDTHAADCQEPVKFHLVKVPFVDGCYDRGGAYWGVLRICGGLSRHPGTFCWPMIGGQAPRKDTLKCFSAHVPAMRQRPSSGRITRTRGFSDNVMRGRFPHRADYRNRILDTLMKTKTRCIL